MDAITDADYISQLIGERLIAQGVLQAPVSLQRYRQGAGVPDSKLVFLSKGRHRLVVTISPQAFPEIVAEEWRKAAQMRSHLGELGAPILEPLDAGRMQTVSYVVVPYREPLSKLRGLRWFDRIRIRRHLMAWLLQVARRSTVCAPSRYEAALQALWDALPADSPAVALLRAAEKRLSSGSFACRTTPMHGDLWKGNVLHGSGSTPFTLIDWRGSEADGFPVFDLVRAAGSFGLSPRGLRRELQLHQAALGCQAEDLPLYLLGALGHYAAHRGEMPPKLLRTMIDDCVRGLTSALEASTLSGRAGSGTPASGDRGQQAPT